MVEKARKLATKKTIFILLLLSTCSIILLSAIRKKTPPSIINEIYLDNKTKTILYWNDFFGSEDMGLGLGSDIFKNCPVSNCYTTKIRDLPVELFDAIIFHGARYSTRYDSYPEKRNPHQKYIFYSLESPYNTKFDDTVNEHFYNWTLTYRRDSDIYNPYALINCEDNVTNYSIPTLEEVSKKKYHVAWFVSNCETIGSARRKKYALELSKYIDVHIYGTCGTYECPKSSGNKCLEKIENDYKFYLSFENSLCADYITEKFYNILKLNVVPIVLGLADHISIAPRKSFIDVYDFDSPKELAQRLREIGDNYEDYVSYFEWKKNCVVNTKYLKIREFVLCQLCELLNAPQQYSSYDNIKDWFYGQKCFL